MAICRDLTKQEAANKKKPIQLLYFLDEDVLAKTIDAYNWQHLDRVLNIDGGKSIIAAYTRPDAKDKDKCYYVGYWNDGVVE